MKDEYIATVPWMGKAYTELIGQTLTNLGLNVRLPPRTTDKTIQIGVRNSAEMICFPFKPTLGNFVEALEGGANTLLMYDSMGECRAKHYGKIQEFTLKNLGYNFEMYNVNSHNVFPVLRKLGGASYMKILRELFGFYSQLRKIDEEKERWAEDRSNIGLIGEIFTCCDERINYGIEKKIENLGVKPVNTVTLSTFVRDSLLENIPHFNKRKKYDREAKRYFNGALGGHGVENVSHLIELVDMGIDGVIHLLPMSCMPETSIEQYVNAICQKARTPLLRIPIDENTAEANLETRLETFVELIKMRGER